MACLGGLQAKRKEWTEVGGGESEEGKIYVQRVLRGLQPRWQVRVVWDVWLGKSGAAVDAKHPTLWKRCV
jgi:hypothetical protein